ncbi:GH1 family beta-glucosidase [Lentzea sp. NPDC051213]|uniref:GH1 family beta-glucosidase n=1 Tax=Lentzea sp. NPDC051213 TaxID=3364126 RepID=UPI0037A5AFF9
MKFPPGFVWGVATSAYQIEGATEEDGRGVSMWDTFSRIPGRVERGETGEVACEHYHRYREDVALMADLGVTSYRFSVAWPRVQPDGRGGPNPKGLDFYSRLVDTLLEHGIDPCPTLYHWDLPQPLSDAGGWLVRDTAHRFAEYAAVVAQRLGDRASTWITHNEPSVSAFYGYGLGRYAPGEMRMLDVFPVVHHLLLSHGLAVRAMRPHLRGDAITGIAHNLSFGRPVSPAPADSDAAELLTALQVHLFCDPAFLGGYPSAVLEHMPVGNAVRDGDLALLTEGHDFLGVNYYGPQYVTAALPGDPLPFRLVDPPEGVRRNELGIAIEPAGLAELLGYLRTRYRSALPPIIITENGTACPDVPAPDGRVEDHDRVSYMDRHLRAVRVAIAEGSDVRGYYVWSLLDNFEWTFGYSKRFGLVHVDRATRERIPKASYHWYRDLIAATR